MFEVLMAMCLVTIPQPTAKPPVKTIKKVVEAKARKKKVHFGSLMDLCHEKNSELGRPEDERIFKGRVVFRGDKVKDEQGYYAVFSEQSASASNMAAAKWLDAIGRMPGNAFEDSDARAAYRQVKLDKLEK